MTSIGTVDHQHVLDLPANFDLTFSAVAGRLYRVGPARCPCCPPSADMWPALRSLSIAMQGMIVR